MHRLLLDRFNVFLPTICYSVFMTIIAVLLSALCSKKKKQEAPPEKCCKSPPEPVSPKASSPAELKKVEPRPKNDDEQEKTEITQQQTEGTQGVSQRSQKSGNTTKMVREVESLKLMTKNELTVDNSTAPKTKDETNQELSQKSVESLELMSTNDEKKPRKKTQENDKRKPAAAQPESKKNNEVNVKTGPETGIEPTEVAAGNSVKGSRKKPAGKTSEPTVVGKGAAQMEAGKKPVETAKGPISGKLKGPETSKKPAEKSKGPPEAGKGAVKGAKGAPDKKAAVQAKGAAAREAEDHTLLSISNIEEL